MPYVDGFIVPVPKKSLQAYRRMAKKAGKIWREHGALEFRECVADDVKVGKLTSFPRSVKLKPSETVVFSWIVYKSRADRDRVNKKVMSDKRLANMMDIKALPFDARRMIYGGFKCSSKLRRRFWRASEESQSPIRSQARPCRYADGSVAARLARPLVIG
jgi:uncharacterized protein YbaA (DUF1428 family)